MTLSTTEKVPMANPKLARKAIKPNKKNDFGFKLADISPLTAAQREVFEAFYQNHLVLSGFAGTGKTFLSLFLALREVLEYGNYRRIVIVRSAVPTRDIGFMPGSLAEKLNVYEEPYRAIVNDLLGRGDAYDILRGKGVIDFMSTSYIRGLTLDKAIIVVDEIQNLTFREIDSVMTRLGGDAKILFCGDYRQTDFVKQSDKDGLHQFLSILRKIPQIEFVEFQETDIVRSSIVRQYIIEKAALGLM